MTIDTDLLILEELERIILGKEIELKLDVINKYYKKEYIADESYELVFSFSTGGIDF